jgi:bifunctional non-homologous end joining protein LigD
MKQPENIVIEGQPFELSNPDKILFPEDGITKADMVEFYRRIAPIILPYLKMRAIVMHRFPEGIHGESFYHKDTPDYFPDWIERVRLGKESKADFVVADSAADLAYLAGQACITPHLWLSRYDRPDNPDTLIFDLDPPDDDFELVRHTAFRLKDLLSDLGMTPFVKTTGSRGVHIVCLLDRSADFDASRQFARELAIFVSGQDPVNLTIETRQDKRGQRLLIDYLRNSYGATAVAPYALRARPGAPVATPINWNELKNPGLNSQSYNISNIFRRLSQKQDPWHGMMERAGNIKYSYGKLLTMIKKTASGK